MSYVLYYVERYKLTHHKRTMDAVDGGGRCPQLLYYSCTCASCLAVLSGGGFYFGGVGSGGNVKGGTLYPFFLPSAVASSSLSLARTLFSFLSPFQGTTRAERQTRKYDFRPHLCVLYVCDQRSLLLANLCACQTCSCLPHQRA